MASSSILAIRTAEARKRLQAARQQIEGLGIALPSIQPATKNADVNAVQQLEDLASLVESFAAQLAGTPKSEPEIQPETEPVVESESESGPESETGSVKPKRGK